MEVDTGSAEADKDADMVALVAFWVSATGAVAGASGDSGMRTDRERCSGSLSNTFSIPGAALGSVTLGCATTVCLATPNMSSRREFGCSRCG